MNGPRNQFSPATASSTSGRAEKQIPISRRARTLGCCSGPAARVLFSLGTILTIASFTQIVRAQILTNNCIWSSPPAHSFQSYPGSTASGGFAGPSLSPYRAAYNALASVTAHVDPPATGRDATSGDANETSSFSLQIQGPGTLLVNGFGGADGAVTGVVDAHPDGSPPPNSAVVYAGGSGIGPLFVGQDPWTAGLDLPSAGSQSSSQSKPYLFQLSSAVYSFRLTDGTRAIARAQTDSLHAAADSQANAQGGWEVKFIRPAQRPVVSESSCPDLDTRNGTVYLVIHGWNDSANADWVTGITSAIQTTTPGAHVKPIDWSTGAGTGCLDLNPLMLPESARRAAQALNNAKGAGRQLALDILKARTQDNCVIDLSKIHVIAHSYGGEVANTAAEELNKRLNARIGEVTLLDMPRQIVGVNLGAGVFVNDFKSANFDHVNNLESANSLTGVGGDLPGVNVTNIKLNTGNYPPAIQLEGACPGPEYDHLRITRYFANVISNNSSTIMLQGPGTPRTTGTFCETATSGEVTACVPHTSVIALSAAIPLPFSTLTWLSVNAGIDYAQAHLTKGSPALLSTHISIPTNVQYIRFSYAVPQGGGADSLSLQFNDELLFFADAVQTPTNVFVDSGLIDVSYLRGAEGELSFVLNPVGETNAQFLVQDLQFLAPVSPTVVGAVIEADGNVAISFAGAPNYTYWVQATTNLSSPDWVTISTNTAGTNGLWNYTDLAATNYAQRFYRSAQP
jgi:hypothetical protein